MKRGYIKVGERYVHYRRAGNGTPVVLLHASPVSSAMFLEQIEVFSKDFDAIAIDTPGYGLSTPLDHPGPEIADYADAVVETLDALGIDRCILYGRHTGASIAVETGRRHPQRVALALCDGYPVFTPGESDRYLSQYLVPVTPSWDGSHLSFWWLRYRDQHVFWPWDIQDSEHRADTDLPDVDFLHRGFTQIMMAGDGYRTAYSAAFRHDSIAALQETKAPVVLTARPGDSLYAAFATTPPLHEKRELPRDNVEAAHAEVSIMKQATGLSSVPPERTEKWENAVEGTRAMLATGDGSLHVRVFGEPDGRDPIVAIAPFPGGFGMVEAAFREIGSHWPVLAIEAPGQSDSETGDPGSIETAAEWIAEALREYGCPVCSVLGWEGSSAIALEIGAAFDASVFLVDPPAVAEGVRAKFAAAYTADLSPHADGRHVPVAWSLARDERLWSPFFDRTRDGMLSATSGLEPDILHAHVVDLFKQPSMLARAFEQLWRYPLAETLMQRSGKTTTFTTPQDRFARLCIDGIDRSDIPDRAEIGAAIAKKLSHKEQP